MGTRGRYNNINKPDINIRRKEYEHLFALFFFLVSLPISNWCNIFDCHYLYSSNAIPQFTVESSKNPVFEIQSKSRRYIFNETNILHASC